MNLIRLIALFLVGFTALSVVALPRIDASHRHRAYVSDLWQRATSVRPPASLDIERLLRFHRGVFGTATANYTYPPAAPTLSGDVVTINRFLNSPTLLARRLRTLLEQRYIADALLTGRFQVEGGAVLYETGETIFSDDAPLAVAPGAEYPLTPLSSGVASMAKTTKWGQDASIYDESIKRQRMNPVNRGLTKLVNQSVKTVDALALSAIGSAVTNGDDAAVAWETATAAQILRDASVAKAAIIGLNQGFMPDTVVVDDTHYAFVISTFASSGLLPREAADRNPVITGDFPIVLGMRWLASPNVPSATTALVVDSSQLGGMADEDLGGPGYTKVNGVGVEAKTIRDEDIDGYRIRARRVTVPIVVEPGAGYAITDLDG